MRKQKMTVKEMEITMNMWAMAPATIKKIVKKIEKGNSHTFRNRMVYNPVTEIITGKELE